MWLSQYGHPSFIFIRKTSEILNMGKRGQFTECFLNLLTDASLVICKNQELSGMFFWHIRQWYSLHISCDILCE